MSKKHPCSSRWKHRWAEHCSGTCGRWVGKDGGRGNTRLLQSKTCQLKFERNEDFAPSSFFSSCTDSFSGCIIEPDGNALVIVRSSILVAIGDGEWRFEIQKYRRYRRGVYGSAKTSAGSLEIIVDKGKKSGVEHARYYSSELENQRNLIEQLWGGALNFASHVSTLDFEPLSDFSTVLEVCLGRGKGGVQFCLPCFDFESLSGFLTVFEVVCYGFSCVSKVERSQFSLILLFRRGASNFAPCVSTVDFDPL